MASQKKNHGDTRRRSWVKSITWRILGIVILGAITYAITRNWEATTGITVIFHSVRLVLYYAHERIWEGVRWGRRDHPLAALPLRDDLTHGDYEEIRRLLEEYRYCLKQPEYEI